MSLRAQSPNQLVNIGGWLLDAEFEVHPYGNLEKSVVICPSPPPHDFLEADLPYLFKLSKSWAPAQFWSEIIAYRVGCAMGVPVPPAFAAVDGRGTPGALIAFFFRGAEAGEDFVHGGDYCQHYHPGFDRKRGDDHSVDMIFDIADQEKKNGLRGDTLALWSRYFAFDAVIGNTDRHQDNWGIIWRASENGSKIGRFAPAFDNATSLGYSLKEDRLLDESRPERIERFVTRGAHHMRWRMGDAKRIGHFELVSRLLERHPETASQIRECLDFEWEMLEDAIRDLTGFEITVPFTAVRCHFVLELLKCRLAKLRNLVSETGV